MGYPLSLPGSEVQSKLQDVISLVKSNRMPESGIILKACVCTLREEKVLPVVAACTELPLAYQAAELNTDWMISSLASLALGCLDRIYSPV